MSDHILDDVNQETSVPTHDDCVTRFMRKRYGIGMLLVLVLWVPLGSVGFLEAVTGNAFLLETYLQLCFVTIVNTMAIVFSIGITRVLNSRVPGQYFTKLLGNGDEPWSRRHFLFALLFSCITPLMLAFYYGSDYSGLFVVNGELVSFTKHMVLSPLSIIVGVALAAIFLAGLGQAKCVLFGSHSETANYLPFEVVDRPGWIGIQSIDVHLAIYLLLLGGFHYFLTRVFIESSVGLSTAPAAVIVLVCLAFLLLGGAANLFDRFRLPVVLVLVILVSIIQGCRESTTTLNTFADVSTNKFVAKVQGIRKAEEEFFENGAQGSWIDAVQEKSQPIEAEAWNAIQKRMEHAKKHEEKKTLVVVTCPGGGIHAAAWATFVLNQLCDEYPDFRNSLCVVSGVSGGSVGSYLFVADEYQEVLGAFEESVKTSSFDLATESSLEAVAFGMMSDDLYGAFLPVFTQVDRGQRLEESILRRVPEKQQNQTMGNWGDLAINGELPIVVFNSTDAATGRRILFDTIPTPRRDSEVGKTSRPFNYRELLSGGVDVSPATAARTSATFPYVSPFTRPARASAIGEEVAICDGGYVDNEGIVTAVDWIDFVLRRWYPIKDTPESPFARVLLLRVAPASSFDGLHPEEKPAIISATRWLAGPLETMVNVRGASQAERGNLETDLAALYLAKKEIAPVSSEEPDVKEVKTMTSIPMQKSGNAAEAAALRKFEYRKMGKTPTLEKPEPNGLKSRQSIKPNLSKDESSSDNLMNAVGAIAGPPLSSKIDAPVVVMDIPFDTGVERTIPLNWKLSRTQKEWYREAWGQIFYRADDGASKEKGELTELMDSFFKPK